MEKQYLIEFQHDSKYLGLNGYGILLISAKDFKEACKKVKNFKIKKINKATGYTWYEYFKNAHNFINLTIK